MLLESQRICLRKRDCCSGHSRQQRVMLAYGAKISLPAGEMENCLMPSFINTGMESVGLFSLEKYEFLSFPHFKITFYYYRSNIGVWQKIRKYRRVKVKTWHSHHSEISPLSLVCTHRHILHSCNMSSVCASNLADSKLWYVEFTGRSPSLCI